MYCQRNVFEGWSFAFIMVIITYLLPVPVVNLVMGKLNDAMKNMKLKETTAKYISGFIGLFITLTFLFIEAMIIQKYRKNVVSISKYIYKTPKNIKL